MRKLILAAIIIISPISAMATAITISDFSSAPENGGAEGFVLQGVQFTFAPIPAPAAPHFMSQPNSLAWCPGCNMDLQQADNSVFDLLSLDLAVFPYPTDITITGNLAGGGSIQQLVSITSAGEPFTSVVLGAGWTDLTSVNFLTSDTESATIIDNISMNVVPAPAAIWLFGSALAGLGWMRRKL